MTFNPQITEGKPYSRDESRKTESETLAGGKIAQKYLRHNPDGTRRPRSVLYFANASDVDGRFHPTQKPVSLMAYLIAQYSNEGDVILDNTMGSGSTGVAALKTNRKFIGIEKEKTYYDIAVKRIKEVAKQRKLF